jgi:transcriptional repressor NrdR
MTPLFVLKRDGRREAFSREKLANDIRQATLKRPISKETVELMVDGISADLGDSLVKEIPFRIIGDMVLERLLSVDKIAYMRFACLYRDFKDPGDFLLELEHLFKIELDATDEPRSREDKR